MSSAPSPRLDPWLSPRPAGAPAALTLGTMNFGKRTPEPEAARIVHRALEHGIGLFDTANAYNGGDSERILGRALGSRRHEVGIATKVGFGRVSGKLEGLSRARVVAALDESLERLGTDHVDLFYLHVPDHETPIEETLSAIATLLEVGKIGAFAVSNFASWQVLEIQHHCDAHGMARPLVSQVLYNMLVRQLELEYFRFAKKHPVHTSAYNALAGGLLTGKHRQGAPPPAGSRFHKNALYQGRYWTARFFELVAAYGEVAAEQEMSLVELAYAWLAGREGVDSILLGPATVEQLDAAVAACARELSAAARAKIDSIHQAFVGTDASYAR